MINITDYKDIEGNIRITCIDGQMLEGEIGTIEDEEESGLGELGLSLYMPDGRCIEIGQSEIQSIEIIGE